MTQTPVSPGTPSRQQRMQPSPVQSGGFADDQSFQPAEVDSGLSLFDMLGFLLRHGVLLALVVLLTGIAVGAVGWSVRLALPVTTVATQGVQFSFQGVEKGEYPNGLKFSPQDVLVSAVLSDVFTNSNLAAYLTLDQFVGRLFIFQGGLELDLLQQEFDSKLGNAKLTQSERDKIVEEYQARRKALSLAAFTLSLNTSGLSIPQEIVGEVLAGIPAKWAEYAQRTRGVTLVDMPMASAASLSQDGQGDYLVQGELLRNTSTRLQDAALKLSLFPGSNLVREANGGTILDLSDEITANYRVRVLPNYMSFVQLAHASNPRAVTEMLTNRIASQNREVDSKDARARQMAQAFQQYVMLNSGGSTVVQQQDGGGRTGSVGSYTLGPSGSMPAIMNLSEGFFDKVIAQGIQSRDVEYRQRLNDEQMKASEEVLAAKLVLDFDTWVLEQIQGGAKQSLASSAPEPAAIRAEANSTTAALRAFASRLEFFHKAVSERNFNPSSKLYRLEGPVLTSNLSIFPMSRLIMLTVAMQALAFVIAVVVLVLQHRRSQAGLS